jgi:hypothetical protein
LFITLTARLAVTLGLNDRRGGLRRPFARHHASDSLIANRALQVQNVGWRHEVRITSEFSANAILFSGGGWPMGMGIGCLGGRSFLWRV